MEKLSKKQKTILFNSLFYFLLFLLCCSSTVFSSSAVTQTAAIFNYCLSKSELFEDSNENLIFTIKNDNVYYQKNRESILKDKKPLLYACGDVSINNNPIYAFESFPLQFNTEDKPQNHYLAQKIYIEGSNSSFNEDYAVIVSIDFYKSLFGVAEVPKEIEKTVSLTYADKTIETRVETVFNLNTSSSYALNNLFTEVYGNDYCFINSNLSDALELKDYCVMLNTNNYVKYFPYFLFKATDYKNIEILSFYNTFSSYFDSSIISNQKTRAIRFVVSSFVFAVSFSLCLLLIMKTNYLEFLFKSKLNFWLVYSLIFIVLNVLIAILVNTVLGEFFILLTGFGISFAIYVICGVLLTFANIFRKRKDVGEN